MNNGAVQTGICFGAILFTLPYEKCCFNVSELGIADSASEVASTTASLIATALSSNMSVGKKPKHLPITAQTFMNGATTMLPIILSKRKPIRHTRLGRCRGSRQF